MVHFDLPFLKADAYQKISQPTIALAKMTPYPQKRSLCLCYGPLTHTRAGDRFWLIASADGMPEIIELNLSAIGSKMQARKNGSEPATGHHRFLGDLSAIQ